MMWKSIYSTAIRGALSLQSFNTPESFPSLSRVVLVFNRIIFDNLQRAIVILVASSSIGAYV